MSKWAVICVVGVALVVGAGCKAETTTQPASSFGQCRGLAATVVSLNGHRVLHLVLPDGRSVLVNTDASPHPGEPAIPNYECPCEEDDCKKMCYDIVHTGGNPTCVPVPTRTATQPVDAGVPLDAQP